MKKLINLKSTRTLAVLLLTFMVVFYACKKDNFKQTTDESVNITGFFDADPTNYSIFSQALVLTGNASYLNAYGGYTVFSPTNEAFKAYLVEQGKTSIDQLDLNELKDIIKLHIIEDTISTTAFTDGKISKATALGQFLSTGARNEGGVTRIVVNKIARILKGNIRVGNGIIHSIDHVLIKSSRTLAQEIAANPSLSIFNEALVATGWNTKLNLPVTTTAGVSSHVAVLAITNDDLKKSGINSFADLKAKYSHTGNPTSLTDSLNLYVAYRVLPGLKYIADIVLATSHNTKAPLEIISVKLVKDSVLLNEEIFNGILEKGVEIDRTNSDITTTNGVLHFVKDDFFIKKRVPTPVYWDVADQPEIRQLPSIFRVSGKFQVFPLGTLKDITWGGAATNVVRYNVSTTGSFNQAYWSDYLEIRTLRSAVIPWIEFRTPVIIRGRYKVWISYRSIASRSNTAEASIDGVKLSRTVNFADFRSTNITETELEAQGFKRPISGNNNNWAARLLGTIDIQTTDRHIFRLDVLTNQSTPTNIDMIHFIPVDQDQLYPRFGPNGEVVPR
ncbi:fasciclin domain-containing protein [Pedobacter alpinus]|uniref:Fasciclin domain-containing protein n=1 Tax=Pedobacter alpinus TaxID=1590643 RepID=A0ABW5TXZ2_9SPHI